MSMTTTDFVQLVYLPLEVLGLVLTVFETFFKNKNEQLETRFEKLLLSLKKFWKGRSWFSWILFWLPWITFSLVIYQVGERETPEYPWQYDAFMLLFFGVFYTYVVHRVLTTLMPNRKLLAFAITLSAIGVAGEIYQVSKIEF